MPPIVTLRYSARAAARGWPWIVEAGGERVSAKSVRFLVPCETGDHPLRDATAREGAIRAEGMLVKREDLGDGRFEVWANPIF